MPFHFMGLLPREFIIHLHPLRRHGHIGVAIFLVHVLFARFLGLSRDARGIHADSIDMQIIATVVAKVSGRELSGKQHGPVQRIAVRGFLPLLLGIISRGSGHNDFRRHSEISRILLVVVTIVAVIIIIIIIIVHDHPIFSFLLRMDSSYPSILACRSQKIGNTHIYVIFTIVLGFEDEKQ